MPLNLSTKVFWVGFPGWKYRISTPFFVAHVLKMDEVNSGPLSTRMVSGEPLHSMSLSSSLVILLALSEVSTVDTRGSLFRSSITLKTLNDFPLVKVSCMKSALHVMLQSTGCICGLFTLSGNLLFRFLRMFSPINT